MKQTPNNDGNAQKDSNANTDASNKPQVNSVYCFLCFLVCPVLIFCRICVVHDRMLWFYGKEYFYNQNDIAAFFAVTVYDF